MEVKKMRGKILLFNILGVAIEDMSRSPVHSLKRCEFLRETSGANLIDGMPHLHLPFRPDSASALVTSGT